MQNGTEKQIAWATEMKTALLAQLRGTPTGSQVGSDASLLASVSIIVGHGTREMEKEARVALKNERRERFAVISAADLRALAIAEMEEIDDAQWWIENRSTDRAVLAIINTL